MSRITHITLKGKSYDINDKKSLHFYDTVDDMKKDSRKIGECLKTLGYFNKNDGGGNTYIVSSTPEEYGIQLYNNLYANMIKNDAYNIRQFGIKDGDDISAVLKKLSGSGAVVTFPAGQYITNTEYSVNNLSLFFDSEAIIECKNSGSNINFNNSNICGGVFNDSADIVSGGSLITLVGKCELKNAIFNCVNDNRIGCGVSNGNVKIERCTFNGNKKSMFGVHCDSLSNTSVLTISSCIFNNFLLNGVFSSALMGRYENCKFSGNHTQTEPSGGGQIDVLSNNNNATHVISGCHFEKNGGINTPAVETYNCDAIIEYCYIDSTNSNYGITLQHSKKHLIIGNNITTNNNCLYIENSSSGNIIGNYFHNTDKEPIVCDSNYVNGCVAIGNIVSGSMKTLIKYTQEEKGVYLISGVKNNVTFGVNSGENVKLKLTDATLTNIMCQFDVNGSQAILLIGEFGETMWIPTIPTDISCAWNGGILTVTNTGNTEHRVNVTVK